MRALFDYDPKEDTLLPCREIGLDFKKGDVLQIMNQNDPNWWQAKKVGSNGPAGLIPSQELEERRKAFVKPEADFVHKISICGTRVSIRLSIDKSINRKYFVLICFLFIYRSQKKSVKFFTRRKRIRNSIKLNYFYTKKSRECRHLKGKLWF